MADAGRGAGLAQALRAHVKALHRQAERSGIVRDILRGAADAQGYALLLRNLLPAYQAMEAGLDAHRGAPLLGGLARPVLYRSDAILDDLRMLGGADWETGLPLLAAGRAYAADVAACAEGDGRRLIGQAYARYMGDLSGGMVLQRIMAPAVPGGALRFHAFPDLGDVDDYKAGYRREIDAAGARLDDWQAVLDAAADAFRFNIEVSKAVLGETKRSPPDPPSSI